MTNVLQKNFLASLVVSLFFDQISKYYVTKLEGKDLKILKGLVDIIYQENTGGVFGIYQGKTVIFTIISSLAVIFIVIIYIRFFKNDNLVAIAIGLQTGGAIGNIVDRLRLGFVIDFIDVHFWPIFNFADVFIVIGSILFAINFIIEEYSHYKNHEKYRPS